MPSTTTQFSEVALTQILKQHFGFDSFRPGQVIAINKLMSHGNLLCIQPTGFGKSLLYQLPSMLLEGLTVVISPLLALMRDQCMHLNHRFKIPAASINSDQTDQENGLACAKAVGGQLKVLFVAPEQLDQIQRFEFLVSLPVSLLVVDEAHCISTWGHDFRPSYRQILHYVHAMHQKNSHLKVLGLTATAGQLAEDDIAKQLSIPGRPLQVIRESMDRPNISLSVLAVKETASKLSACEQLVNQLPPGGLIYCATRENTELVASFLKSAGISAEAYHAGLDPDVKRRLQGEFVQDKYRVLAATNALGMGIDKSNLRFIIHFDIPGSITAYYQEVGRCGRDGNPAYGLMLYDSADIKVQRYFIESAVPTQENFNVVLDAVKNESNGLGLSSIKAESGLHPTRVTVVVSELVEQNYLVKKAIDGKQRYQTTGKTGIPDLERYERQLLIKQRELDRIVSYAEAVGDCRMSMLRESLGDSNPKRCGHCCACHESQFRFHSDPNRISKISLWLDDRPNRIEASPQAGTASGLAVLNGTSRTAQFKQFMKYRQTAPQLSPELALQIETLLRTLLNNRQVAAVFAVPSRTWASRDAFLEILARVSGGALFSNALVWNAVPPKRQGELLNNDQRKENVGKRMGINCHPYVPPGVILLVDDYIGSGATIKEAARVIRKEARLSNEIIPFTIAAIKWRLGASGMI